MSEIEGVGSGGVVVAVGAGVGGVKERLVGRAGRPWYGNPRDEVVRAWVARLAAVNAEQVAVRWGLDVRTARRIMGRLVADGWLREVPQGRARFTVWQPRPALVRSVLGSESRLRLAQPWHPLAVTAALVVCELAGWEVLADVELNRMRERRSYDRPAGHPWATQSPGGPQHLPDLVLQHPHAARPIAVEVELTRK